MIIISKMDKSERIRHKVVLGIIWLKSHTKKLMKDILSDVSRNQRHCDIVLSDRNKEILILCGSI